MGLYTEGLIHGGQIVVLKMMGLYTGGLIHGGAYFRNFTVYPPWLENILKSILLKCLKVQL